jgi:hypothetical protein
MKDKMDQRYTTQERTAANSHENEKTRRPQVGKQHRQIGKDVTM